MFSTAAPSPPPSPASPWPPPKRFFGDPPEILGSGSARPEGTATVTEGGYLINGRWNYLSGIDHSTALFLNCRLLNQDGSPALNEDGSPATRVAVVPVAAGTVLNTWTTLGMRGTASNDCEFANVFVPSHHSYMRGDPSHHPGPLYHPAQTSNLISWTLARRQRSGHGSRRDERLPGTGDGFRHHRLPYAPP